MLLIDTTLLDQFVKDKSYNGQRAGVNQSSRLEERCAAASIREQWVDHARVEFPTNQPVDEPRDGM